MKKDNLFAAYFWLLPLVIILVLNSYNFFSVKINRTPSLDSGDYADKVISQSDFVKNSRNLLDKTEYPKCYRKCSSFLHDGFVAVGFQKIIVDGNGADFIVYEIDNNYDPIKNSYISTPSDYTVYASNDGDTWHFVGYGNGITFFDLASAKLKEARYIKISGFISKTYMQRSPKQYPNIDAIEIINSSSAKEN